MPCKCSRKKWAKANWNTFILKNMFVVDDAAAIRSYAQQGLTSSWLMAPNMALLYRRSRQIFRILIFAWGTTVDTFDMPNVHAYEAASDEGGFVNGVMAALLTETKVIGVVGPIETGDAKLYIDGFAAGVKSVDPEIDVRCDLHRLFL